MKKPLARRGLESGARLGLLLYELGSPVIAQTVEQIILVPVRLVVPLAQDAQALQIVDQPVLDGLASGFDRRSTADYSLSGHHFQEL